MVCEPETTTNCQQDTKPLEKKIKIEYPCWMNVMSNLIWETLHWDLEQIVYGQMRLVTRHSLIVWEHRVYSYYGTHQIQPTSNQEHAERLIWRLWKY
jgi:hypothetical protein